MRPIAYASRTLNLAEINYSTIEKETLAIWPYLLGHKFEILSDHKPLIWLFKAKDPGSRLLRWRLKLKEYEHSISYIPGTQNTVAEALSQIPTIHAVTWSQTKEQKDEASSSPLPSLNITKVSTEVSTILVFTSPDLITSPLTKEFNITGNKREIIRHRIYNKNFFLIFYKQTKQENFDLDKLTTILKTLNELFEKYKTISASIYNEIHGLTRNEIPKLERIL